MLINATLKNINGDSLKFVYNRRFLCVKIKGFEKCKHCLISFSAPEKHLAVLARYLYAVIKASPTLASSNQRR
jgi:hypothetical protein